MSMTYAPIPHELIMSQPAPLVRLWGVLHWLEWHRETYAVDRVAELCGGTRRSVYRWLEQLAAAGWIDYRRTETATALSQRIRLSAPSCDTRVTPEGVTPESQGVTPESQGVTPESQGVTPESQGCDTRVTPTPVVAHSDAVKNRPQTPDQTPDQTPEHGGGGDPARARCVAGSPTDRVIRPSGYPASRAYLIQHGAISESRIAEAAALPCWMIEAIHTACVRELGATSRAIGRTLVIAAAAARDPSKATALAAACTTSTPAALDPQEVPNDHAPRRRSVGSGRRRTAAESAQPAPHLAHGSDGDDDLAAIIADAEAWADRQAARRRSSQP